MMKIIFGIFLCAFFAQNSNASMECTNLVSIPTNWIDLEGQCLTKMREQIQMEIKASFQYLAMGAHFSRDTVNLHGFADFFFNSAKEEREHGIKLIEYLSMRGLLNEKVNDLITIPEIKTTSWVDGISALTDALQLEISVTENIRALINDCSLEPNYYHLADYLTGVYLEEQLKGQRDLAGKLATLKKMTGDKAYRTDVNAKRVVDKQTGPDALAEFLFDKEL